MICLEEIKLIKSLTKYVWLSVPLNLGMDTDSCVFPSDASIGLPLTIILRSNLLELTKMRNRGNKIQT